MTTKEFNRVLRHPDRQKFFAERMRSLREESGKTQEECADALGIHQPNYSGMENGNQRIYRADLVTLAALYKMPLKRAFPGAT